MDSENTNVDGLMKSVGQDQGLFSVCRGVNVDNVDSDGPTWTLRETVGDKIHTETMSMPTAMYNILSILYHSRGYIFII